MSDKKTSTLVKTFIQLMEKGKIPDFMIRSGIRHLLKERLKESDKAVIHAGSLDFYIKSYVKNLKNSPLAIMTQEANQQHYEVPTEFYDFCLGDHKKYSSCFWDDQVFNLIQAEKRSLDISIERAQIKDGQSILELGCGWGSLSLELARRFPNSKIVSVSNSKTQKSYIDQKAKNEKLNNLTVMTKNLGLESEYNFGELKFDRVMSIEMMEHIRNYDLFFKLVSQNLNPGALFFIHIFTHKTTPYFFETEGDDNWMGKYFFSGGQMPSRNLFLEFQDHFKVQNIWDWNGQHYQKTLESWLMRMDDNEIRVRELFAQTYGQDQVEIWVNRWRVFYMSCAELFGFNEGQEWGVTHYLLERK